MRSENFWKVHPIEEWRKNPEPYNEAIETCFEYSDNPEKLKHVLDAIEIKILFEGIKKYFIDDKEKRQVITVRITRKNNPDNVLSFEFGMSLNDTETLENNAIHGSDLKIFRKALRVKDHLIYHLIYDLLACIHSDSYFPELFEDFCSEYGYDNDSIKAKNIFDIARPHAIKINRFFTSEELESFPS